MGAIVGPLIGGYFIAMQWTTQEIFMAAALPALISAIVMFVLRFVIRMPETAGTK
jgi:MFS transporter, AAHS family, 4-hydroxybenzoate transporter